jgi:hypothetical protein
MTSSRQLLLLIGLGAALLGCDAFVVQQQQQQQQYSSSVAVSGRRFSLAPCNARGSDADADEDDLEEKGGFFAGFVRFFEELDAFVDDASARRLGNGAAFYGKRKSKFYGEDDKNKKKDKTAADPTEDYQGPTSTGLFQWIQDEDGQMRPVTRGKNKIIERPPEYWDRYYEKQSREEQNQEE